MADRSNPLILTYQGLWDCLLTHPQFVASVREANRINFISDVQRDPTKADVQLSDLPEVILDSQTASAAMMYSSSGTSMTRQYAWLISTGDFRIQKILYQIEWQIFCAMHAWTSVLTNLQWQGASFVKRAAIIQATDGMFDAQRNRGIKGWSAVWACEVEMHFKTSDIRSELSLTE